ncbi:unnamed protein product [Allacma fusca]|uniref:Endonuclease/exonuclease/phosphatase family domain-containing protein 1 n=1 Tax=Allacma fusca TaxID=39272 RepID=A0A8J2KJV1_9HEXA|nr:unnamed protein product [Allacma fusca]
MGQRSSSTANGDCLKTRRPSDVGSELGNGNVLDELSPPNTIRSSTYLRHKRSTASLTSLFRKRRWKKRRGSISASFSINDNDIKVELLNVNTANEEELMTLAGVNRTLARNIINHRQAIGGFRKVEDLALVSGMGATKLDFIRPEICISRRKVLSRASSKSPSIESIPSIIESTMPRPRPLKVINVNSATIFDLMTISGINQALAARIITYRDRKGPFKSIDDLKNVGISYKRLGAIRMYFTTEEFDSDKLLGRPNILTVSRSNSHISTKTQIKGSSLPPGIKPNTIHETNGDITRPDKPLNSQIQDLRAIYELMSVKTTRPRRTSDFNYTHNCLPAYRVATWNLDNLTAPKISNPGVLEVFTRTILENGFSLIALQEICDKKALDKICRELNEPTLPKNREWRGPRGLWKGVLYNSSIHYKNEAHHLGVLYNSEQIDEVSVLESDAFSPFQNGSLWLFAVFRIKVKHSTWILINVLSASIESSNSNANSHVQSPSNHKDVMDAIKSLVKETDGALIMGHFNAHHAEKGLGNLEDLEKIYPGSSNDNEKPGPCSLWVTSELQDFLTTDRGTVEEGLNHIAIPNGWSWNGRATASGPLWCTLYNVPRSVFHPELISSETEEKTRILEVPSRNGKMIMPTLSIEEEEC